MGKEYQRPEIQLPQQFNQQAFPIPAASLTLNGRNFLLTLLLQTLIERGITHNHDLLIAINRIDIAEQYVKQRNHGCQSWISK